MLFDGRCGGKVDAQRTGIGEEERSAEEMGRAVVDSIEN